MNGHRSIGVAVSRLPLESLPGQPASRWGFARRTFPVPLLEPRSAKTAVHDFSMDWVNGTLIGNDVKTSSKTLEQMRSLFLDQKAVSQPSGDVEIYRVQSYTPVDDGTEGGLFWGSTI